MADHPKSDPWLDVLAGRAEPSDAETRQALQAREYFERNAAADAAAPVDEQRLKRLLNSMEVQAAARRTTVAKPTGSILAGVRDWLFPAAGGAGLRWAGTAAAAFGVAVVALLAQPGGDDSSTMKAPSFPDKGGVLPGTGALVVTGGDPIARALELKSLLSKRGVSSEVLAIDGGARIDAVVPASQESTIQADVMGIGVPWPGGSRLSVEFRAAR